MTKFKKWAALLVALCLTVSAAALITACANDDPIESTSQSSSEDSTSEIPAGKALLTVSVKDQDGNALSAVEINVLKCNASVVKLTTNENGMASAELEVGVYKLELNTDTLPILFIPDVSSKTITFTEACTIEFEAEDMNPNGTADKPFSCYSDENGEFKATIPANTTHHYMAGRIMGRKIVIETEGIEITFTGQTSTA